MQRFTRSWNVPTTVLAAGMLAMAGYQALAARPPAAAPPSEPTSVAVVDLETLYAGLTQKAELDGRVKLRVDEFQKKLDDQKKAVERLEQDLDLFAAGTPRHDEALKALSEAASLYRTHAKHGQLIIELEKGRVLREVYATIKKEARQLAEEMGFDLVLVDDSVSEIPPGGELETTRQISARRVLHANPRIDITTTLIERMNRAFLAGAGN
jgi:Skp family chaperone for outer membrane proteins